MQYDQIDGQASIRLQLERYRNRLVQFGSGNAFTGLCQTFRRADGPTDHIIDIVVGERRAGVRLVPQAQHMIGDRVAAYGHVPVASLVRHIHDFFGAFDLCGHHILGTVGHQRRYRIGLRHQRLDIEIGQSEQFRIDVEDATHDRLVAVMRANQREILRCEKSQRMSWRVDHGAEEHLKRHIMILLQQI